MNYAIKVLEDQLEINLSFYSFFAENQKNMKKFEYAKTLSTEIEELNKLGDKGWELVTSYKIRPEDNYTWFVFKREELCQNF